MREGFDVTNRNESRNDLKYHVIHDAKNFQSCESCRETRTKLIRSPRESHEFQWKIGRNPVQLDGGECRMASARGETFRWPMLCIDYTAHHFHRNNYVVPTCNLTFRLLFRFSADLPPIIFIEPPLAKKAQIPLSPPRPSFREKFPSN